MAQQRYQKHLVDNLKLTKLKMTLYSYQLTT